MNRFRSALPPAISAPPPGPDRMTRLRLMLLALAVSLWAVVIGVRLLHLQVLERASFDGRMSCAP